MFDMTATAREGMGSERSRGAGWTDGYGVPGRTPRRDFWNELMAGIGNRRDGKYQTPNWRGKGYLLPGHWKTLAWGPPPPIHFISTHRSALAFVFAGVYTPAQLRCIDGTDRRERRLGLLLDSQHTHYTIYDFAFYCTTRQRGRER